MRVFPAAAGGSRSRCQTAGGDLRRLRSVFLPQNMFTAQIEIRQRLSGSNFPLLWHTITGRRPRFPDRTEPIGARLAAEVSVCLIKKVVRLAAIGQFPAKQNREGKQHQADGIRTGKRDKRRADHKTIPIIDSANRTAPVFQKKNLKRAEKCG